MAEEGGGFEAIGKVLPSVYYDLVARVCSGVPVLLAFLWGRLPGASEINWPSLFLLAGAGYIVGLIITPLSFPWRLIEIAVRRIVDTPGQEDWRKGYSLTDEIGSIDKDVGTTLHKMQAEAVLCENLFGAFVILQVLDSLHILRVPALSATSTVVRALLFVLLAAAGLNRVIAEVSREKRLYDIYCREEAKTAQQGR